MLTRKSTTAARTKMLVFIPVIMVCLLCFSKNIFSQNKATATGPVAKMAKLDISSGKVTSWDAILEDPTVVCSDGGQVTEFTLSFQPKSKDYVGPYKTSGNRFTAKQIEWINKFKAEGIEKVQMFVEDIHVKYKGADKVAGTIIVTVLLAKK